MIVFSYSFLSSDINPLGKDKKFTDQQTESLVCLLVGFSNVCVWRVAAYLSLWVYLEAWLEIQIILNEALLKRDCDLSCPYYSTYSVDNPPATIQFCLIYKYVHYKCMQGKLYIFLNFFTISHYLCVISIYWSIHSESNINIYSWRKKSVKNKTVLAPMANLKDI